MNSPWGLLQAQCLNTDCGVVNTARFSRGRDWVGYISSSIVFGRVDVPTSTLLQESRPDNYLASGLGRIWKWTALLVAPLPPS